MYQNHKWKWLFMTYSESVFPRIKKRSTPLIDEPGWDLKVSNSNKILHSLRFYQKLGHPNHDLSRFSLQPTENKNTQQNSHMRILKKILYAFYYAISKLSGRNPTQEIQHNIWWENTKYKDRHLGPSKLPNVRRWIIKSNRLTDTEKDNIKEQWTGNCLYPKKLKSNT